MTNKEMTNEEARRILLDIADQMPSDVCADWIDAMCLGIKAIDVLEKIKAEIEEYKSRQLTLAISVDDLEKGKQIALEYVLAVIDKCKGESEDKGEISDGYHTFNQLYHQRAILFATVVNQNKDKAWKSFKHSDGKYCFDSDGEWFIVGIDTPQGSYTYHYSKEYWDMFDCQELECGKEWDGHTEEDVTRLLSLEQQPNRCDSCIHYEEQDGSNCYECVKGMSDNFEAQSTNITVEMHPKEAIEILEHERDNDIFVTTEYRARIHQALTMGIKALKAQIKANECFNNTDSPMIRVNLESQLTDKCKGE